MPSEDLHSGQSLPSTEQAQNETGESNESTPAVFAQQQGALSELVSKGIEQLHEDETVIIETEGQTDEHMTGEAGTSNTPWAFISQKTSFYEASHSESIDPNYPSTPKVNKSLLFPWLNNMDPYYEHRPKTVLGGLRLNKMDAQLVHTHLEQYLPTPSTRFQLMRDRLNKELRDVYIEIERYKALPAKIYAPKIQGLEERAALLRQQILTVDRQLHGLNPFQGVVVGLESIGNWFKPKNWCKNLWNQDPLKADMIQTNQEIQAVRNILDEQLHDPMFTAQHLGELVNQYDHLIKHAEALASQLKSRQGWRDTLNDKLQRTIRRYYGKEA